MPRPRPARRRRPPVDHLGGPPERHGPVAVGRRVAGDERLARAGEVAQAQLERVDAELARGLVHVRFDRPDLLGIAEATERGGRHGVRQDAARDDPRRRRSVRPHRGVAALGHGPVGDVRVRADEVVRLEVAEDERPVAPEAGPHVDAGRAAAHGLERLLEGEHEPDRPADRARHEREERLVLGVLLAAERAAGIGGVDAHLGERQVEQLGDDALQPVRVLDGAPDRDAVAVGRGHERVRLDRELGDHRERVGALDDDVRRRFGRLDGVAPGMAVFVQDVARGVRIVRAEGRVLDERRVGGEGRGDGVARGQLLVVDPDELGGGLGGVAGLGGDRGHRVAVVLRLAGGDDRAVAPLGAEARDGLG